jgi:adenylate cyclase
VGFEYLGEKTPKNFAESVGVYSVGASDSETRKARSVGSTGRTGVSKRRPSWSGLIGQAQRFGAILAILLVIDVATGDPFWVQWPALGIAIFLAFRAVPLIGRTD